MFGKANFDGRSIQEIAFERPTGELIELRDEVAAAVAAVREGKQQGGATGEDGLWSAALCEAARESIRRSVEVSLASYSS